MVASTGLVPDIRLALSKPGLATPTFLGAAADCPRIACASATCDSSVWTTTSTPFTPRPNSKYSATSAPIPRAWARTTENLPACPSSLVSAGIKKPAATMWSPTAWNETLSTFSPNTDLAVPSVRARTPTSWPLYPEEMRWCTASEASAGSLYSLDTSLFMRQFTPYLLVNQVEAKAKFYHTCIVASKINEAP